MTLPWLPLVNGIYALDEALRTIDWRIVTEIRIRRAVKKPRRILLATTGPPSQRPNAIQEEFISHTSSVNKEQGSPKPHQTPLRHISCLRAGTDFCALFFSNRYARNKVGLFDSRLTIRTEYVNNPYSHSPNSSLTHDTSPDGFRDLTSAAFLERATPSAPPPSSFCSTKQVAQ